MAVRGRVWERVGLPAVPLGQPPAAIATAVSPLHLLAIAAQCEVPIPRTLITNDPHAADDFAAGCRTGVLRKPLRAAPTHPINGSAGPGSGDPVASAKTDAIAYLVQERAPTAWCVRVPVAGARLLAARISDDRRRFTPVETHRRITGAATALVATLGLTYAVLDFAVAPGGGWVLLGLDPNDDLVPGTERPIITALADRVTAEHQRGLRPISLGRPRTAEKGQVG